MCFRTYIYVLIMWISALPALGQNVTVRGVVSDSLSHEPIPYASVLLLGTDRGALTDENGRFSITTGLHFTGIQVAAMGYDTKRYTPRLTSIINLKAELHPTGVLLSEVTAKPKKEHYSKKNNPAVEFMEKIRARQDLTAQGVANIIIMTNMSESHLPSMTIISMIRPREESTRNSHS